MKAPLAMMSCTDLLGRVARKGRRKYAEYFVNEGRPQRFGYIPKTALLPRTEKA